MQPEERPYRSSFGMKIKAIAAIVLFAFAFEQVALAADDLDYNKRKQDDRFAPAWVKKRAAQKDALLGQQGIEEGFNTDPSKHLRGRKKPCSAAEYAKNPTLCEDDKKGGGGKNAQGQAPEWELGDFNEAGEPQTLK